MEVENTTRTEITSKKRIEKWLWSIIALKEVVINTVVYNDYSREVTPKFEFFDDHLEITSYGGIAEGLEKKSFFEGVGVPFQETKK